jgi:hypothetical protein
LRRTVGSILVTVLTVLAPVSALAKEPVTQFLPPEKAPAIESLKGARIVGERLGAGPSAGVKSTAPEAGISSLYDCFWESDVQYCFDRYDQSSTAIHWDNLNGRKAKLRGTVRVDNRDSSQPSTVRYKQGTSGSHKFSVTGHATVSGNIGLAVIAEAEAEVGMTLAFERTWSSSTEVEDEWSVPARRVGYTYCYNPAVSSGGALVYKGYWRGDPTEPMGERRIQIAAFVPSDSDFNYRHVEANS